ncbi:DNA polymerase III subunit beta [Candidatus Gottesmanbacteria bacterium]|nr:DNA polymerase III subunit beta [Candidatus Gottesmanbacteria bacterium]
MHITVLQENLLRALIKTGRAISTKPQLPVLSHVLLETENGGLRITATNMETTESVHVAAKVEKAGALCVPSRVLTELVSSLPAETAHLVAGEGSLSVRCAGFSANIPGVASGEFPPVPQIGKTKGTSLQKQALVEALTLVLFAAATDEGRPLLTGVRIEDKGDSVVFAATDGYRLSMKKLSLPLKNNIRLVVPARALSEVVKVSQEDRDSESVSFLQEEGGQLVFVVGDTEIFTRPIEGEYPNFEKIIPATHNTRVLFEKEALVRAVKSAAIFARDNANIIRFHIENQSVVVSANTPQVGENQIDVAAKVDGDGGDIAFNSRFLVEFLANFSGEELLFEMTGGLNAVAFRPVNDDSFLHVIMPVRVASG